MKLFLLISCLYIFISCGKPPKDKALPKLPNLGTYTATYMISDTPLDANNDGIYSTDFFEEFIDLGYWRGSCKLIRGSKINNITFLLSLARHRKPRSTNYPDYTLITRSALDAEYDPIAKKIVSDTPVVYSDGSASDTRITYCELIDDETVMVRFHHTLIYDIAQQKWITLQVEAMYKKLQLN